MSDGSDGAFGGITARRIVPSAGFTAWLTLTSAAAMAFLAVFALALALASGRVANRWTEALSQSVTVRIPASAGREPPEAATRTVLRLLAETPGVVQARALPEDEQAALLEPWFGADLPLDSLPLPRLVAVTEAPDGFDAEGLRMRLAAEVPGAVFDDHGRWRRPLANAAERLRLLGLIAVGLIALVLVAMVTLAAQAALAANAQVIEVLRLVGARDVTIARAFTRRFSLRALAGAAAGTAAGMGAVALLDRGEAEDVLLTGLAFEQAQWLWPLTIPPLAAAVTFWATRAAALRNLRRLP